MPEPTRDFAWGREPGDELEISGLRPKVLPYTDVVAPRRGSSLPRASALLGGAAGTRPSEKASWYVRRHAERPEILQPWVRAFGGPLFKPVGSSGPGRAPQALGERSGSGQRLGPADAAAPKKQTRGPLQLSRVASAPSLSRFERQSRGLQVLKECNHQRGLQKQPDPTLFEFQPKRGFWVSYKDAYAELEAARRMQFLTDLFLSMDEDGSGEISFGEFQHSVLRPDVKACLAQLGVQPHQASKVFNAIDTGDGEVNVMELMQGLEMLTAKSKLVELEMERAERGPPKGATIP